MEPSADTAVMVFTRDLRLRDNPALVASSRADRVIPLFVLDDAALRAHSSVNRTTFLVDCLADLRQRLRSTGSDLILRRGDWVEQIVSIARSNGATQVHLSDDVSGFAQRRFEHLAHRLRAVGATVSRHPSVTVVAPGAFSPTSGGDWKVFTPYYRRWLEHPWRAVLDPPTTLRAPAGIDPGELPPVTDLVVGDASPELPAGGESVALDHLRTWAAAHLETYEDGHDDLPGDATSHIAAHLHLGTLSPLEVAVRLVRRPGGAAFVRQLCWRDFYHQTLAGRPEVARADYRPRNDHWRVDPVDFAAWTEGRTGFPVVDAGMRQLRREGFMHNRARMIVASFLTKDLYLDWRLGASHFMSLLVDGDIANNQLNWQWTAGTGADANPNRIFNPTVQSTRFDPDGDYIRRYVAELADVAAPEVHEPSAGTRDRVGYPRAIVDHREAIAAYRGQLAAQRA